MITLTARRTLEKAWFFVAHAAEAAPTDREAFIAFLEAAIVFGRSVTLHLQKELAHEPGFADWYAAEKAAMKGEALLTYFRDTRNFILKEGPAGIRKEILVTLPAVAVPIACVEARVIRSAPWYRRSPRILWADLLYPIRRRLRERQRRRRERRLQRETEQRTGGSVTERFIFDDSRWRDRPALAVLGEYLGKLDAIVTQAESRWRET